MHDYTQALQGGILMGLASWILLAGLGRSSNVSGIAHSVMNTRSDISPWRWAFLFGLVGGGALFSWLLAVPHFAIRHPLLLVPAGFLVGFGAVLGSGSASAHAIVGMGRRSRRSIVAVLIFAGSAVGTVLVTEELTSTHWWGDGILESLRVSPRA